MDYKMDIGNELAKIKNCKTQEEIIDFIKQHNLDPRSFSYFWGQEDLAITFDAVWNNGQSRVDISVTVE